MSKEVFVGLDFLYNSYEVLLVYHSRVDVLPFQAQSCVELCKWRVG